MVTYKLTAIRRIITAKSFHLLTQRHLGQEPDVLGGGKGSDIKDMVLVSRAMKQSYDHFIDMLNHLATETGDLHTLQQIKEALDATLENPHGGQ